MNCVSLATELTNCEKRLFSVSKKDYKFDIWREFRKRWMIVGVLIAMTLAVLSPKVGAPGGPLHTEYLSYLPLFCVYFSAGTRLQKSSVSAQTAALSVAHAHAAAPALWAAAAGMGAGDPPVVRGALLSSIGAPCAWLSLVVAQDVGVALALLTLNYVTSLVAAPITMFFVCGRAPIPALGPTLWSALCALPPLLAGLVHGRFRSARSARSRTSERVCSLALLYVDCCERTASAPHGLYVADVLSTLLLAVWCVSASALVCLLYTRLGLTAAQAHSVAVCAVPKALHNGWETSINCVPAGLSRLPSVFLAPTQALLLAAIADYDGDIQQESEDSNGLLPH